MLATLLTGVISAVEAAVWYISLFTRRCLQEAFSIVKQEVKRGIPQGLKPAFVVAGTARLKPCPSQDHW